MKVTRRASARLMAGAVAITPAAFGQAPAPQPRQSLDPAVQSAVNELLNNGQRIARVKLPRATEPAFKFRP